MKNNLVKIRFELNSADWHECASETLWGKPLVGIGKPTAFEVQNSPFNIKGVSYLDVIRAIERDGQYEFVDVIARSGHSTYRLLVDQEDDSFKLLWKKLHDLGCTYESGDFREKKLFTVDVPAATDIYAVYALLEAGERQKVWAFEEGHVGHPLKDKQQIEGNQRS